MAKMIGVRLSPASAAYLATLQARHGGSVSDVIRELIEEARQRQQAAAPPAELAIRTLECACYTASLVTGLVRKLVSADAAAMIEKARADAATIPTSQPATCPTPFADDED